MEGLFVGLMSGTSVDSIDAVIVNLSKDRFELVEEESTPIQNDLKNRIFEAVNDSHTSKNNINDLDIEYIDLDEPNKSIEGIVMDELGLDRYCCRRMILGNVHLITNI